MKQVMNKYQIIELTFWLTMIYFGILSLLTQKRIISYENYYNIMSWSICMIVIIAFIIGQTIKLNK